MQNILKEALAWIGNAVAAEMTKPIKELSVTVEKQNEALARLEQRVSKLHEPDEIARECDLSVMDDRICYLIDRCREKGYTTANDRRRVGRMHDAYKARGGNHGEEKEYEIFCQLKTEEEFKRGE